MFEKIIDKFKYSKESQKFPFITSLLFTFSFSYLISKNNSLISKLFDTSKFLFNFDNIPIIPYTDKKKTLIFDFKNLFTTSKFSFKYFDFFFYKRYFSEEFLFFLFPKYELINITDSQPSTSLDIISKIDPYGCISYRLFVNNKKRILPKHLNRNLTNCVILSTEKKEFDDSLNNNVILLQKWNGDFDKYLFELYIFLNNIAELKDLSSLIKSYKDKNFEFESKKVQKINFLQQNLFSFKNFENELKKEEIKKIKEYNKFDIKVNKKINYKTEILYFIKNIIL